MTTANRRRAKHDQKALNIINTIIRDGAIERL